MATRTYFYDNLLTPSELEDKGIKAKKNHVYYENKDGSVKTRNKDQGNLGGKNG